jgi:hypothetical protein
MLKWLRILLCLFALPSGFALAQNIADDTDNAPRPVKLVPQPPTGPVYIRCGALFSGKTDHVEPDVVIVVERDRIKQVGKFSPPAGAQVIDLPNLTCLPGMVEGRCGVQEIGVRPCPFRASRKPLNFVAQALTHVTYEITRSKSGKDGTFPRETFRLSPNFPEFS